MAESHETDRDTYSGLSWNTSRDDNNIGTRQSLLQAIIRGKIAFNFGRGGYVGKIGSNTGSVYDIVETKLGDRNSVENPDRRVYRPTSVTRGLAFKRRDKGWPIPP